MGQRGRDAGSGGARRRPTARGPASAPATRGPADRPAAPAALRSRVAGVLEPILSRAGYDLDDLVVTRVGRRNLIKVVVDADSAVTLDAVAEISRRLSDALDIAEAAEGEFGSGPYTLEVTSPGVDRPLTEPRHWRRNVGRLVKVSVDDRMLLGRISAATAEGVVLEVDGTAHEAAYGRLGPGRVQVEFGRATEAPADADDDTGSAHAGDVDGPGAGDVTRSAHADEEEDGQEDQV